MFTVYFRNSTTTPSQPGLRTLVDAALGDCGAEWTGQEAELALPDGSLFYLFGEDDEEGMLLEYPALTDAVAEVVYAIADRTSAFILDDLYGPSAFRTANSVGEVRAADMSMSGYSALDDAPGLYAILADLSANSEVADKPVARPVTPKPKGSFEDQTFLSKLADAIFGKKI